MAQTEHWPRHHAVDASAFAISSCICMKISSGASAPPRLCGSSERYSPFSTKAETTGAVSRRVRSISSASCRISGASARARSTRSKLGSLFMRFLAFFWLLTGRERNGGPSAAADQGGAGEGIKPQAVVKLPGQPEHQQKGTVQLLSCCRFDGHQVWVFYQAGGGSCGDVNSVASSRSKRSSWSRSVGYRRRRPPGTSTFMRMYWGNGERGAHPYLPNPSPG